MALYICSLACLPLLVIAGTVVSTMTDWQAIITRNLLRSCPFLVTTFSEGKHI